LENTAAGVATAPAYSKWFFWMLMIVAQTLAFLLFKDLADISQWVVQSSRAFTMSVWYLRWPIAVATLLTLGASLVIWCRNRELLGIKWVVGLTLFCIVNFYSGMFNTWLMFRPQQYEGQAKFVSVAEAPPYLEQMINANYEADRFDNIDDISVIVLETDQGARAYTDYYLLQPHVAHAGTIDGEEVVMTYCGLTNMGVAYSPVIDGQPLNLRVMTQLKNNLVMWDTNSGEPIQQFWGSMERDGRDGPAMKEWPSLRMPFATFRKIYPQGLVFVNGIEQQSEHLLVRLWDWVVRDGMMLHAVKTLQWQTDKPAFPSITEFDDRLPTKQIVWAFNVNDDYVAYTKEFIDRNGGLLNVTVGGQPVVVYYDKALDTVAVFNNHSGGDIASVDLSGYSDRGQLLRMETLKSGIFWFIWYEFNRSTDVNRA